MDSIKKLLQAFIEGAKLLGLNEPDLQIASDFLNHNEFGLCFETIMTQMYEYDIEISEDYYALIIRIANKMNLTVEDYFFMRDLIRSDSDIPRSVKEQLSKILNMLMQ